MAIEIPKEWRGPHTIVDTTTKIDLVNHPPHYLGKVECIEAIEAATEGLEGIEAVCTGTAIKYLFRWHKKGGKQDLEKAIWYVNHLISKLDQKNV